jgi:hydrogenase maturation protein HypF
MTPHLEDAARLVRLGAAERRLLHSAERPIVLCPRLEQSGLSPLLAPDSSYIGLMLPYTPLHQILLRDCAALAAARPGNTGGPAALVMTSGNRGGEPIALGNREALRRLAGLADCFLLHDRDILIRVDDSVLRPIPRAEARTEVRENEKALEDEAEVLFLRRARGFAPSPLPGPAAAHLPERSEVLALGAELKNTICLSRGGELFVSQHIGDLENPESSLFQEEIAAHLRAVLQVRPRRIVADSHPLAHIAALPEEAELLRLPHHFAHACAVLAENAWEGPALVLALDGTGFAPASINPDQSLWGGELIFAHPATGELRRLGSLKPLPLPGGEAAIRAPWRIAHALLHRLDLPDSGPLPWLPQEAQTAALIPAMLEHALNTPFSSGAGRLFDAVSALLGLCLYTSYEGQAAIRLEEAQEIDLASLSRADLPYAEFRRTGTGLSCPLLENSAEASAPPLVLDTHVLFRRLYECRRQGAATPLLARAFHYALAEALAELALAGSRLTRTTAVGLSGGVMQNLSLFLLLKAALRARGLRPLTHHRLPPNDACISYGQAVWAGQANTAFPVEKVTVFS